MTAEEEPAPPSILAFRLSAVEHSVAKLETRMAESFGALSTQLASLAFVRSDVYASEQARLGERIEALRTEVETTHKLAMWAVGLVCGTVISAILLAVIAVSGVFAR